MYEIQGEDTTPAPCCRRPQLCVASVIFQSNEVRSTLEKHSTKAIAVGESNKATGGQRGFGGGATDAAAIFQLFFQKYAVLGIFWSKFLLKTTFLNG